MSPNAVATQIHPMTPFEKASGLAQNPKPQTDATNGALSEENLACVISVLPSTLVGFLSPSSWILPLYKQIVCLVAEPITVYLSFINRPVESQLKGTMICSTRVLINRHSNPLHHQSALNKVQVCVLVHSIVAFVLLKQIAEFIHVQLVEGIKFLTRWLLIPLHPNWPSNCREVTGWRTTHSDSVYFMICNMVYLMPLVDCLPTTWWH